MGKFQEIILTVLLSVLVSGGATYIYFSNRVSNLEGQIAAYATKAELAAIGGRLDGYASKANLSELKGTVDQIKNTFDITDRVSLVGTIARESQKETQAHLSDKEFVIGLLEPTVQELFTKNAEVKLNENAVASVREALENGVLNKIVDDNLAITEVSNDYSKCVVFKDFQICWGSKILVRGASAETDHTANFLFEFPRSFSDFPSISNGINMAGSGHILSVYNWHQDQSKTRYVGTLNNAYVGEAIGGSITMTFIAIGPS